MFPHECFDEWCQDSLWNTANTVENQFLLKESGIFFSQ